MCGIVGAIAERDVSPILLEGLRRLEYRGYDSAGLAIIGHDGALKRIRRVGKVKALAEAHEKTELHGGLGIAHTRWATHGQPNEINAHPHFSAESIAVVHNGIIENHETLREELRQEGYDFTSDTDSEVIAHLIHFAQRTSQNLTDAVLQATQRLSGAYGAVVIDQRNPDVLVVARSGSPMVIGRGIGEMFVASDQLALLPVTNQFLFLEEGEVAEISRNGVVILNQEGKRVKRDFNETDLAYDMGSKGKYRHFMIKEIHEQARVVGDTLEGRISSTALLDNVFGVNAKTVFEKVQAVQIVACGTSYHAALVAKYWFEAYLKLPCQVEIASEFRYRKSVVLPDSLFVTISQSGETADTLAALRIAKSIGYEHSLAICNVPGSSLVRESDLTLMTRAGAEIGVASTKAFTTQLVSLLLLMLAIGKKRELEFSEQAIIKTIEHLPRALNDALAMEDAIEVIAEDFAEKNHALFLGRGIMYPIAMEGALKLKEISYIHAEAYAAGELKHGPLALIDADMPIIVVAPNDELLEKLKSNVEEVRARGGKLYVFADAEADFQLHEDIKVIRVPSIDPLLAPILYTLPLQLLSYHVAIIKGTDVDQPRNLAKSVTVE